MTCHRQLIFLVFVALAAGPVAVQAADEEVLARGQCYVRTFSAAELAKAPDLAIRRIELQFNRYIPTRPGGEAANRYIEIGLTPRADDEAPSTAGTGECKGTGQKLSCTFSCDGNGEGSFRIEPAGKNKIRFIPEGTIAADACFDGVPPFEMAPSKAHPSFMLTLAGASDCFH
jgi:hypothetical protein